MIDEEATFQKYGYTSDRWAPQSHKPVIAACDECGDVRVVKMGAYRDLCHKCALWKANKKRAAPPDYNVRSIDDAETFRRFRHHAYDLSPNSAGMVVAVCVGCGKVRETPKQFYADLCHPCRNKSDKNRQKQSATVRGMSYDEWDGYATEQKYCYKFNNDCRERNRDKHGHTCFICGMEEHINGRKLSVHHIDNSKSQGCDGEKWKLVPLCNSCHGKVHNPIWQARIEYLLKYAHI